LPLPDFDFLVMLTSYRKPVFKAGTAPSRMRCVAVHAGRMRVISSGPNARPSYSGERDFTTRRSLRHRIYFQAALGVGNTVDFADPKPPPVLRIGASEDRLFLGQSNVPQTLSCAEPNGLPLISES
jgi:hypothetical protein